MDVIALILASGLRSATPLMYAAIGGIFSERSGVVNIALEGIMLTGAFTAMLASYYTGSPWLGVLIAMIAGGLISLIHAFVSIEFRANQVVSGVAINLLASGLTSFFLRAIFKHAGQSPSVNSLGKLPIPIIKDIPFIGTILSGHSPLVYLALLSIVLAHFVLFKTTFGLRVRAVGEHPEAADTVGINVKKIRYICVVISGIMAGIGGATLSIGLLDLFTEDMTAGRGFIALAAVIFGKWTPFGAFVATLLFGIADAMQMLAQTLQITFLPREIWLMLPYILTLFALAGFIGRATPPAASGQPYDKED
ncbi:branched-chain amino acid ABC transporter permease [Anoxybacter fermentans]|uniref:Branched-chain amino acid ABC transporter permease n=1 Tax=Anoxybacter fermentans TaxID=1323375 RepID=A0A3Q9HP74_9FIRM|nr:ABC transporter permease [Anoxybacter fermentans]AZR72435.1 branched-chain amino acid ABC transporter permease [Anoxybacter fermentans]